MLQEELLKTYADMKEGLDEAPDSPIPFPVIKDDKMSVIGDVNKTDKNAHDFKIVFEFPVGAIEGEDKPIIREKEYKNVFISPQKRMDIVSIVCRMMPFFRKIMDEKGNITIEDYSTEEIVRLVGEHGNVFAHDMYDLVATVLGIDDEMKQFMQVGSVLPASSQIFKEYPDVINEAEAFFS